jgi:HAD superfamily hydrolase (TIGR01509 family)
VTLAALIFDVDGTLADTEEAHRVAFNEAFMALGVEWQWDAPTYRQLLRTTGGKERLAAYLRTLGRSDSETAALGALIPELHAEKTRRYTAAVARGDVPLRPGVARLIDEALDAGTRLAIATTTTAANVDALLTAAFGTAGRQWFGVIACGDEVKAKKPAPDIYRLALDRLALPPQSVVALEDSEDGLRAANGAGLFTVVTPCVWTTGQDFRGAGLLLPNLGSRQQPLPGEPGDVLQDAGWLTFAELERAHRRRSGVAA